MMLLQRRKILLRIENVKHGEMECYYIYASCKYNIVYKLKLKNKIITAAGTLG